MVQKGGMGNKDAEEELKVLTHRPLYALSILEDAVLAQG